MSEEQRVVDPDTTKEPSAELREAATLAADAIGDLVEAGGSRDQIAMALAWLVTVAVSEQHSAVRGCPNPFHLENCKRPECVAPPEPAPGSREGEMAMCKCGHAKIWHVGPNGVGLGSGPACHCGCDCFEAAPIAEPPAPEAGERVCSNDWCPGVNQCVECDWPRKERDAALAQVEALKAELTLTKQSLADEQGKHVELFRRHGEALVTIEKLTDAKRLLDQREVSLLDDIRELKEERDAIASDERAAVLKAKVYGEKAYKWRKRCIDTGQVTDEDRILADEWEAKEQALTVATSQVEQLTAENNQLRGKIQGMTEMSDDAVRHAVARAEAAEGRAKELDAVLRSAEAWSLRDALERLADFAHDRLTTHSYDGHGWEELQRAKDVACEALANWGKVAKAEPPLATADRSHRKPLVERMHSEMRDGVFVYSIEDARGEDPPAPQEPGSGEES